MANEKKVSSAETVTTAATATAAASMYFARKSINKAAGKSAKKAYTAPEMKVENQTKAATNVKKPYVKPAMEVKSTNKAPEKSKESGKKYYEQKKAASQARRNALNAGKSQAGASKAANRAVEAGPTNLKDKMKRDAQAAKKPEQKLSWWQKAKNKAKSVYNGTKKQAKAALNGAKEVYKSTKGKVSKALDKTPVGRAVKKVARPFVRAGEKVVKTGVNVVKKVARTGKNVAKTVAKGAKWVAKSRVGRVVAKYGPKTLKWTARAAKWCSKRVPVVCTVVGGAEACYYLMKGEYLKAGVAVTSAVAGNFPPVGTAIGIAAEGALVGVEYLDARAAKKAAEAEAARKVEEAKRQQQQLQQKLQNVKENVQAQVKDNLEMAKKIAENKVRQVQTKTEQAIGASIPSVSEIGSVVSDIADKVKPENVVDGVVNKIADKVKPENVVDGVVNKVNDGINNLSNRPMRTLKIGENGIQLIGEVVEEFSRPAPVAPAKVTNQGESIVVTTSAGKSYTLNREDLEQYMSSKRAKGTMDKLQKVAAMENQPAGLEAAVTNYIPELRNNEKGTAKVNRNWVDSTVKAVGGSSKVTSISIDGKKIKSKDIQETYGCTKKEAKRILKAYGRAIEDGANMDEVLRDIAQGKKRELNHDNANIMAAMQQRDAQTR